MRRNRNGNMKMLCAKPLLFFLCALLLTAAKLSAQQVISTPDTTGNTVVAVDSAAPVAVKNDSLSSLSGFGSSTDSLKKKPYRHSPLKAALFSAALPGLGQAYNKKYWKIPIVYAGFGGLAYAVYFTSVNFNGFKNAYRAQVADPPNTNASYQGVYDAATLKEYRDYYKKYLDIAAIGMGVWYILNIVDATVDAHLFEWNMKDDLSVSWQPAMLTTGTNYTSASAGVKISIHF
ncbi:MAG TPA: DUF5683 domain-containing protein [Chitinophagales bacterium]|nr:DUF5683 domain-containing protein [Chitinophagales bacterium]